MSKKKLADYGFAMGDIVTYASDDDSTGGVIFQIAEHCDPVIPHEMRPRSPCDWLRDPVDEKGKRIPAMCINGYVRLKPMFAVFPTELGKRSTLLLYYNQLHRVKKVDLILLGTKYMELGNLIRDLAVSHGMELPT